MPTKKILILVLSFNDSIYNRFYNIQKETWDSINHPDVKTMYFFGKKIHFRHLILKVVLSIMKLLFRWLTLIWVLEKKHF